MAKGQTFQATVLKKRQVTPHMLRVSVGGEGLQEFPEDQPGAYFKLVFPGQEGEKDRLRTYTVRQQFDDSFDIDFMVHEADGGLAISWAMAAQPGDTIQIRGPGPNKTVDPEADWFLFAGDMTALPAISANIQRLPADAKGYAVLEVVDEADRQQLNAPAGIEIKWIVNDQPGVNSDCLVEAVKDLPWAEGRPGVWCACEFSSMRKLRDYFRNERGVDKSDLYISSYWKLGREEEAHKKLKREDNEAAAQA